MAIIECYRVILRVQRWAVGQSLALAYRRVGEPRALETPFSRSCRWLFRAPLFDQGPSNSGNREPAPQVMLYTGFKQVRWDNERLT
jgi:hypothetical protein